MNSHLLCAAKCPWKKPFLKAKNSQITIFEANFYIFKPRAFQKWPWICYIFIFKELSALFLKILISLPGKPGRRATLGAGQPRG